MSQQCVTKSARSDSNGLHLTQNWLELRAMLAPKKKKKVDYEALNSALMRIPRMDVAVARNFIDIGIHQIYELQGRAPEVLFEEAKRRQADIPDDRIRYFRMAVYYAEHPDPDQSKLHPDAWN
jgi:hypothetical protein